jgi:hypothetical protein
MIKYSEQIVQQNQFWLAPNVPAVGDGFAARIRACVARPGLQNCGCSEPWEWAKPIPRRTKPRSRPNGWRSANSFVTRCKTIITCFFHFVHHFFTIIYSVNLYYHLSRQSNLFIYDILKEKNSSKILLLS